MKSRPSLRGKDLGSSLEQLVDELGIRKKLAEYEAVLRWESLVGEHVARAASAVRIANGVLVVKVRTSSWRNELSLRKAEIIKTINTGIGRDVVKDIRFQ
jgi:predicted nucleic acid-binding Zn ribbon protein